MSERVILQDAPKGKTFKDVSDAWQTKVQESLWLPRFLPWLGIAGIIFGLGIIIEVYLGHNLGVLKPSNAPSSPIKHPILWLGIQCALIAALANSVVLFEYLMDRVADTFPLLIDVNIDKAKTWIRRWYNTIFWSKLNLIAGLLLAVIIVLLFGQTNAELFTTDMKPGTPVWWLGLAYSYFITFAVGFMGGSCLWTALSIACMFFSMGRSVQIKSSIFDSRTSLLRMASRVLLLVAVALSMIYFLGVSTVYVCDIGKEIHERIIMVFFAALILAYFIVPQINIHKHLIMLKQARLSVLVEHIDYSFNRVARHPSPENISQLRDLVHLQNVVNSKKSWSFGLDQLLALICTILGSLLPILLNLPR